MVEKYQLCYSADAYFGARPAAPLSADGQLKVMKSRRGHPNARFQLTLEPEVILSARRGVLEATIHFAFVLTDTAPVDDDDATSSDGIPIQMGSVAHVHSEGELPQLMAGLDPDDVKKLFLTASGLLLEGDQEPSFSAKMGLVTERIQEMLYNLVMAAKDAPPEDGELRRELRDCLSSLTPVVYLKAFWTALDRLQELCMDYERGKETEVGQGHAVM